LSLANHVISGEIARLKRLYTRCSREKRPGKRRFAFYEYLYQLYAAHERWRADMRVSELKRHIAATTDSGSANSDVHLIKLMIDATCPAEDYRTRSRWGQALRFVWRKRKDKTTSRRRFDDFLSRHGGVAGCANKVAKAKLKSDPTQLGAGFDERALRKRTASQEAEPINASGITLAAKVAESQRSELQALPVFCSAAYSGGRD
jgi:hypothetical protein